MVQGPWAREKRCRLSRVVTRRAAGSYSHTFFCKKRSQRGSSVPRSAGQSLTCGLALWQQPRLGSMPSSSAPRAWACLPAERGPSRVHLRCSGSHKDVASPGQDRTIPVWGQELLVPGWAAGAGPAHGWSVALETLPLLTRGQPVPEGRAGGSWVCALTLRSRLWSLLEEVGGILPVALKSES